MSATLPAPSSAPPPPRRRLSLAPPLSECAIQEANTGNGLTPSSLPLFAQGGGGEGRIKTSGDEIFLLRQHDMMRPLKRRMAIFVDIFARQRSLRPF